MRPAKKGDHLTVVADPDNPCPLKLRQMGQRFVEADRSVVEARIDDLADNELAVPVPAFCCWRRKVSRLMNCAEYADEVNCEVSVRSCAVPGTAPS
jgi:hypothetical protein